MRKYETPVVELIKYEVVDCLTGSTEIPKETQNIDEVLGDLI
jgi:hypothetical protein